MFENRPEFYRGVAAGPNRLEARSRVLIDRNVDLIRGKRIIDLGSYNGRWSWAALQVGAHSVVGIEARQHLVDRSHELVPSAAQFVRGDAIDTLRSLTPGLCETIFCFGLLYHVASPFELLRQIRRLKADLILDTKIVSPDEDQGGAYIQIKGETTDDGHAYVKDRARALVGVPNKWGLEKMLTYLRLDFRYLTWDESDWTGLKDYRAGRRVSLVCKPKGTNDEPDID